MGNSEGDLKKGAGGTVCNCKCEPESTIHRGKGEKGNAISAQKANSYVPGKYGTCRWDKSLDCAKTKESLEERKFGTETTSDFEGNKKRESPKGGKPESNVKRGNETCPL